jgi:hypothetical protein
MEGDATHTFIHTHTHTQEAKASFLPHSESIQFLYEVFEMRLNLLGTLFRGSKLLVYETLNKTQFAGHLSRQCTRWMSGSELKAA